MLPRVVVIGGGIIGLATAFRLLERFPAVRVRVLEKESQVAQHQSGHNSGVIHSGVYYRPASRKAQTCLSGRQMLLEFCRDCRIPTEECGKVIVATDASEIPLLQRLYEQGRANGVPCALVPPERLRELEPEARGICALHVSSTAITDFRLVSQALARRIVTNGGEITTNARVLRIQERTAAAVVVTTAGTFEATHIVNCAGLFSDGVVRLAGEEPPAQIVPFRGEYYSLTPDAARLCQNLIYPVPDPRLPFLGVHLTRRISGGVDCGPNAVLALAREGYHKTAWKLADAGELLRSPAVRNLAKRHWRSALDEWRRSLSKRAFAATLRRLVPAIQLHQLRPGPTGVRAQAVGQDGRLLDDFVFHESRRMLSIVNAPSPAATACLAIADVVVQRLAERLELAQRQQAPSLARFGGYSFP